LSCIRLSLSQLFQILGPMLSTSCEICNVIKLLTFALLFYTNSLWCSIAFFLCSHFLYLYCHIFLIKSWITSKKKLM
jgi:hypothetical protein